MDEQQARAGGGGEYMEREGVQGPSSGGLAVGYGAAAAERGAICRFLHLGRRALLSRLANSHALRAGPPQQQQEGPAAAGGNFSSGAWMSSARLGCETIQGAGSLS